MGNNNANPQSFRLLVLSPFGKDAEHLRKVLGANGFDCCPCKNISELIAELASPPGAVVITEEIFTSPEMPRLMKALGEQPAWSAVPVLAFYSPRDETGTFQLQRKDLRQDLSDFIFLPRPVSATALISAVKGAIRDRARQYRIRDDIVQREAYEVKLEQANAELLEAQLTAQRANQSKSQFLANMSHEIRTPLGAIMGFAELIAQRGATKEEIANYASVISRNSSQLLRIIDDILDLSKVEAGRMEIERYEFSLPEMLADFSSLLALRARDKGVEFKLRATTPLPDRIVSDSVRLRQILINVVGNSIKFTERGHVSLTVACRDQRLCFTVEDTGRGISSEQEEALFRPFAQADTSTTREFGGTGLGLVLTKRLCAAMGGDFVLKKSELGHGSTFEAEVQIEIPGSAQVIDPEQIAFTSRGDLPESPNPDSLKGSRILVVEDSPDNRELIRILLTKAGAVVDFALNGIEGVSKALAGDYSLILMDIQMPHMDGLEATRMLRQKGMRVPIVAITAHAMKGERERCLEAGCSEFLAKPIQRERLLEMLVARKWESQEARAENGSPTSSEDSLAPAGTSILLVEDDADIRELLTQALSSQGYQVAAARDAEHALDHLDRCGLPKLILLDLTLPNLSGADFMERINSRKDRSATKVIIASGWDDLPQKSRAVQADGYIKKPIDLRDLDSKIAAAFV